LGDQIPDGGLLIGRQFIDARDVLARDYRVWPSATGNASAKAIACSFSIHLRLGSREQKGHPDIQSSSHFTG
jgi:hypothetical protein